MRSKTTTTAAAAASTTSTKTTTKQQQKQQKSKSQQQPQQQQQQQQQHSASTRSNSRRRRPSTTTTTTTLLTRSAPATLLFGLPRRSALVKHDTQKKKNHNDDDDVSPPPPPVSSSTTSSAVVSSSSSAVVGAAAAATTTTTIATTEPSPTEAMKRTHILPVTKTTTTTKKKQQQQQQQQHDYSNPLHATAAEYDDDDDDELFFAGLPASSQCCTATAILQHSYMELLCNGNDNVLEEEELYQQKRLLPDDPTVQESIECIFASQLEEGLPHYLLLDEDEDENDEHETEQHQQKHDAAVTVKKPDGSSSLLAPPSTLQQSLLKSRSEKVFARTHSSTKAVSSNKMPRKRRIQNKLVHVRTFDPKKDEDWLVSSSSSGDSNSCTYAAPALNDNNNKADATAVQRYDSQTGSLCMCCQQTRPLLQPDQWPQRPLLLRPTPGSGTRIRGIRFAGSNSPDTADKKKYLWKAREKSVLTWPTALQHYWEQQQQQHTGGGSHVQDHDDTVATTAAAAALDVMCPECMVLPVNNGNEPAGETLVTDFETDLFVGTLLLRLRYSEGTTPEPYDDNTGYFAGMNRRYQAVIQGRFKKEIPLTECVTGFVLERPCGKLLAKFIVKGALKVVSFFAPQLDARLDGDHPHSITPLGSTPQTIIVQDGGDEDDINNAAVDLEEAHQEPTVNSLTLLQQASSAPSSMQRARFRKKAFDRLFSQKSPVPKADPSKIYTFEFLQHLFDFQEFTLAGGSLLGSIPLAPVLL